MVEKRRQFVHKMKKVQPKRPYAVEKLKNTNLSSSYHKELRKKLKVPQHPSIEEQWSLFSHAITETAETVLGRRMGTNKERWITEKTLKLIDERRVAKMHREQKRRLRCWRMKDGEYRCLDREVEKSCRKDQRKWLEEKAREAQEAAEKNNSKTLHRIVRDLTSSRSSSGVQIKSRDARALLSDEEEEARWVEHFREVLNQRTPSIHFNSDREIPAATLTVTSEDITMTEVAKVIKSLKNGKAPGLNKISAELLKHCHEVDSLTHLFKLIWHAGEVPANFRRGVNVNA